MTDKCNAEGYDSETQNITSGTKYKTFLGMGLFFSLPCDADRVKRANRVNIQIPHF